jgi:hypothetical protein
MVIVVLWRTNVPLTGAVMVILGGVVSRIGIGVGVGGGGLGVADGTGVVVGAGRGVCVGVGIGVKVGVGGSGVGVSPVTTACCAGVEVACGGVVFPLPIAVFARA